MKNEKKLNVLLVEDNKLNADVLSAFIKTNVEVDELKVQILYERGRILDAIKRTEDKPHLVILSEPERTLDKINFSAEIPTHIKQIKKLNPESEVIVLSSPKRMENVVETFRSGAYDLVFQNDDAANNMVNAIHRFIDKQEEKWGAVKQQKGLASATF